MRSLYYPLKHAWSSLSYKPGFALTVITTMGLALGLLICVITLAYLLLIKPLPYPHDERLYRMNSVLTEIDKHAVGDDPRQNDSFFSYPNLVHIHQNNQVFDAASIFYYDEDVLLSHNAQPTLKINYVSSEWFGLTTTDMALGRAFTGTEQQTGASAVITYQTWQQQFAGSADVLSETLSFRGNRFAVVGVLPKDYVEPLPYRKNRITDVYLPWQYNTARLKHRWSNADYGFGLIGLLAESWSVEQANQHLYQLGNTLWRQNIEPFPGSDNVHRVINLTSLRDAMLGNSKSAVYLLLIGVIGLVFIASSNLINLFLSRLLEQQQKLALQAALGADRRHIFVSLLAESTILMGLSLIVALFTAGFTFWLIETVMVGSLPRAKELTFSWVTLLSAIGLAGMFAYLFAWLGSKSIRYHMLNVNMQSSGKQGGIQVSKQLRSLLVAGQVSVACVLLFANIALFSKSYTLIHMPLGYEADSLLKLRFSYKDAEVLTEQQRIKATEQVKTQLLNLPQVETVSISRSVLDSFWGIKLSAVGEPTVYQAQQKHVDSEYFRILNQPVIAGRHFTQQEFSANANSVIINELLATKLNTNKQQVIGRQLDDAGDIYTIVGVVSAIKEPGQRTPPMRLYLPKYNLKPQMMVKIKPATALERHQIVKVLEQSNSPFTLLVYEHLPDKQRALLFSQYAIAYTSIALALTALLLAFIGLFGILSYSTQLRRFELGTRIALGAKPKDILRLVVKENSRGVGVGVVIGLVLLLITYPLYSATLGLSFNMYLLFLTLLTLTLIAVVSFGACYWPLQRYIKQPAVYSLKGENH